MCDRQGIRITDRPRRCLICWWPFNPSELSVSHSENLVVAFEALVIVLEHFHEVEEHLVDGNDQG